MSITANFFLCLVRVDCKLSEWTEWGECSVSCGGGIKTRTKTVLIDAKFGGDECPKDREQIEQCNSQCCVPGMICLM